MSGLPKNSGFDPTSIEGRGGILVHGGGNVVVDGSGAGQIVSAGAFQRLPSLVSTGSTAPVLFWSVPFTLSDPGDIVFLLTAIVFLTNTVGPGIFLGFTFSADLDNEPLIDAASLEASPAGQTAVLTVPYQLFKAGVPAGPHTLNVFWQSLSESVTIQTAANEANISIRRV